MLARSLRIDRVWVLALMGAAPFAAGADELNHLEYFLAYLSNGLPLKANAGRPRGSSTP